VGGRRRPQKHVTHNEQHELQSVLSSVFRKHTECLARLERQRERERERERESHTGMGSAVLRY
jgi:hypothetical protein